MFPLFFHHLCRRTARYFSQNRTAKITTASLFVLLFLSLSAAIFLFFLHGFRFLSFSGYFEEALLLYLSELFMFTLFVLIFVSALITGLFSLFSGKEKVLLALSPKFPLIPLLILTRMFFVSLWPILILILPALLALSLTYQLSFWGALFIILALALFVALAVITALSLIFLVAKILFSLRKTFLTHRVLVLITLLFSALFISIAWQNIRSVSLNTLFSVEAIENTTADITLIQSHFSLLPSHPAALAFFAVSQNNLHLLLQSVGIILAFLCLAFIPFLLLKKNHLSLWQHFQEIDNAHSSAPRSFAATLSHASGPLNALFRKEIITFFRNTRGMTWFGFFCLIWLFQNGSTFILNHQLSERPQVFPYIVITLQIAAAIYFVNMFVLRFAFPSFSMEQKMSWVIESAPLDKAKIFLARIGFYVPLLILLGFLFSLLNTLVIPLSSFQYFLVLSVVCLASATTTLYGLALGALFPNFETDDPEFLSTSLPGLTFIFTSVLYGGFAATAVRSYLISKDFTFLILFFLFSLLVAFFSVTIPLRYLRK